MMNDATAAALAQTLRAGIATFLTLLAAGKFSSADPALLPYSMTAENALGAIGFALNLLLLAAAHNFLAARTAAVH
jgi:hypothetical protein